MTDDPHRRRPRPPSPFSGLDELSAETPGRLAFVNQLPIGPPPSFYDQVGGHEMFVRLVTQFYAGVANDPVLRPMYPETDLNPAADRLLMFLEQYWGGPATYLEQRGHPQLRRRHATFTITPEARNQWLRHMRDAVDSLDLAEPWATTLWKYLERAAWSLVNAD